MSEKVKLIVTLSKGQYENLKDIQFGSILSRVIFKAVQNGIPLPKGHGRLIDADAFIEKLKDSSKRHKYKELLIGDCLTVDDVFKAVIESLQNEGLANGDAPTIIEADKENKDE